MKSTWRVSDAEVSATIRYLDPDLYAGSKIERPYAGTPGFRPWSKVLFVVLSMLILLLTAAKVLPMLMRLLD